MRLIPNTDHPRLNNHAQTRSDRHIASAESYIEEGKWNGAKQRLERAVEIAGKETDEKAAFNQVKAQAMLDAIAYALAQGSENWQIESAYRSKLEELTVDLIDP